MCEIYGFCGNCQTNISKYTNEFWKHSSIHKDGFGYYLADKDELYVNHNSASNYLIQLAKQNLTSSLALCHIRFKTHGEAKIQNCHPFVKKDIRGNRWALIHNGYTRDNPIMEAMHNIQNGETDSERILMYLVESVNSYYEHNLITDIDEFLFYLFIQLEATLNIVATLGKTNLIFTDDYTHNMYVFINHPNTLFYLETESGIHFSTAPLSNEDWIPVEPNKLHVFNNGVEVDY